MSSNLKGYHFLMCDNWIPHIQLSHDQPIKYCEIGVFYGHNLFRFAQLFPNAELVGIDPWLDYNEYDEYKGTINSVYDDFKENLAADPNRNRITIHRGFSHNILKDQPDQHFDIVYIDGNHSFEFVLADAELAYQKVKVGGYIIFDDVDWEPVQKAFFHFLSKYTDTIKYEQLVYSQTICRRSQLINHL